MDFYSIFKSVMTIFLTATVVAKILVYISSLLVICNYKFTASDLAKLFKDIKSDCYILSVMIMIVIYLYREGVLGL